jgi:peptidyl-prolyl cis-trans isomerase D
MRQLAHSWIFKGLMMLLVVSFGIWGIGDMFRGNSLHRVVAKAGNVSITVQDLNRAFEQSLARARQMFGPEMTAQQAKQMGLAQNALDQLIENSLVDQDLKRLGIEADDRAVFQQLMQDPQFKNKDGKFDKSILQNLLAQARISENAFLSEQRKQLASRQLVSAFSNLPPAPQSVLDALYKARGQKRILDIITLDNDSLKNVVTPSDSILSDFYQQTPQPFTQPETRGVTIALLSTDAIAKDITISDDQVKKEYDSKSAQLAEPEKRDLLQVVLQDEGKAKDLAAAAKASGNLVSAAKPTGREVMPLNQSEEDSLPPELAKPIFALHQGDVSEPIKTTLGWHVMQVRKITPAGVPKYEAIKETLRETIKRDQAVDTATRLVNQLDDELAAGHPLEDVADGMKLRLVKVAAIDSTGKTPDGKAPAELPQKDDALKSAFAQNSGETSPVMDDKNGTYFVVRTDTVTPSALKPFEQVKPAVIAAWKKQDQSKRAGEEAESIAKALREGKTPTSFAAREGIEVRASKPISLLGDADPSLPKTALPQILKLKKGEVIVLPQPGKQLILRLAEITSTGDKKDESAEGKIAAELNSAAPKDLADEYIKYLRVLFPVKINQDAFDSIAQQGG